MTVQNFFTRLALMSRGTRILGWSTTRFRRQGVSGHRVKRLQVHWLVSVAGWERAILRERTREGLASARERGVRLGRRPRKKAHKIAKPSVMLPGQVDWLSLPTNNPFDS